MPKPAQHQTERIVAFDQQAFVVGNDALRIPPREGWAHIRDHFRRDGAAREVGIVLPVGCGKSGLIAIAPYAVGARRTLLIAPGTRIVWVETPMLPGCSAIPLSAVAPVSSVPNGLN